MSSLQEKRLTAKIIIAGKIHRVRQNFAGLEKYIIFAGFDSCRNMNNPGSVRSGSIADILRFLCARFVACG